MDNQAGYQMLQDNGHPHPARTEQPVQGKNAKGNNQRRWARQAPNHRVKQIPEPTTTPKPNSQQVHTRHHSLSSDLERQITLTNLPGYTTPTDPLTYPQLSCPTGQTQPPGEDDDQVTLSLVKPPPAPPLPPLPYLPKPIGFERRGQMAGQRIHPSPMPLLEPITPTEMPMPLEQTRRGLNIDDLGYDSSLENIYDLNPDNDIRNAQLAIERTAAWMARKEHGQPIDRNTNTRDVPLHRRKRKLSQATSTTMRWTVTQ